MCGISGIIKYKGEGIREEEISLMMKEMKHRGPDDEGVYLDKNIGLGFVRLSIIDLSQLGHQPMVSNDGCLVIVFNGEIYNYIELREKLKYKYNFKSKTDTEVILAAYQEWGEQCLDKFNGMFAFAIYNECNKKVFIARDRYGIKPLFYYKDKYQFIFASEIKSILPFINKEPNNQELYNYLVYSQTDFTESTAFKNVFRLRHGHFLKIDLNGEKENEQKKWYNLSNRIKNNKIITPDEYKSLLESSIKLRLRADVPIGVSLSGGLDSSSITSIVNNNFKIENLKTFSAVYKKGDSGDESKFIDEYRRIISDMYFIKPSAESLLDDYQEFIVAHGEPISDVGPYIQYKVMELASKYVKVTLDGQGADEQLAGYHYFYGSYFKELLFKLQLITFFKENIDYYRKSKSLKGLRYLIYYMLPDSFKFKLRKSFYPSISKSYIESNKKYNNFSSLKLLDNPKYLMDSLINHFEYWLEHLLKWEDINSMHFSIESRIPFLDYRLVEATLSTPSNQKIKNGYNKFILRESMKEVLPKKILYRMDKKGFSNPKAEWFRSPKFEELIRDIINSKYFIEMEYFDVGIANKQYDDHLLKISDNSIEIWKWINVYEWHKKYFV